ncbi:hypothetical protein Tco_1077870 [Tanacetum coccineum]
MSALRRSDIENKLAWLVLTEPKVNPTKSERMTKPYSSTRFIADFLFQDSYKDADGDASFQHNLPLRYQVYQGRLLASFQDDAKYEHVGQDTRSQGGKDNQDRRIKI